ASWFAAHSDFNLFRSALPTSAHFHPAFSFVINVTSGFVGSARAALHVIDEGSQVSASFDGGWDNRETRPAPSARTAPGRVRVFPLSLVQQRSAQALAQAPYLPRPRRAWWESRSRLAVPRRSPQPACCR